MKKVTALLAVLALVALGVAPIADAQQRLNVQGTPNYGSRTIASGFMPDPLTVQVTSGGSLNVASMNLASGCTGFATAQPDFNLTLTSRSAMLRFFVDAGNEDTTLIINKPDGTWVCADDTYGRNPGIDVTNAPTGLYNVWIGSYASGTRARGTLNITERPTAVPGNAGGGGGNQVVAPPSGGGGHSALSTTARPNFGARNVAPGFPHDPISISVTSGGNLDAGSMGLGENCGGWVTSQPDFNFTLTGTSAMLRVYVNRAASNGDTTLIINRADGTWTCNDDSYGGVNPSIDLNNAGPGLYNVWIGSYQSGSTVRAKLNLTELPQNHP